jgi:hypothetical protein
MCVAANQLDPFVIAIERRLEGGVGMVLVKGLPTCHTEAQWARALIAVGCLLGRPVSQTPAGTLVARVEDGGQRLVDPGTRGHRTKAALAFHCDRADRVALLCVRRSQSGGQSHLASSIQLYEDLCQRFPKSAEVLMRPIPQDIQDSAKPGGQSWISIPVFAITDGTFTCRYIRRFIDGARDRGALLTDDVLEALEKVDLLLAEPGRAAVQQLVPGDLQIINNNVILHGRNEFRDGPTRDQKRLLLRLWLSHVTARPLPPEFMSLYGRVGSGEYRGGVWRAETNRAPVWQAEEAWQSVI